MIKPREQTMSILNPFFHRGPIRDQAYFFGRDYEMSQALSLLANGQSVSLMGQRRIGKTSLLFHLANPEIFTQYGLNSNEHLFVYLDCGGLSGLDQFDLYRVLLEEIDDALVDKNSPTGHLDGVKQAESITYRTFERTLRPLIRQGWKPIILLDEFEGMSRNPHLDPDFFSGLRALTARYPLAYVTASKQPLLALTYADAGVLSSPFFNIFANIRLGLFTQTDAYKLVASLANKGQVAFTPTTVETILNLAGPHPFFLQIAGFHAYELWQAKKTNLVDEDYLKLDNRFRTSVEEHFIYYWRNLSAVEQRILATLPASQNSQADIIRQLEQSCLIRHQDEGYNYLSSTFCDFVHTQPVPGLLQAGPIAIDEKQHQVLSRGHPLNLTATQYTLLLYLVKRAGQVVTTQALEQALWDDNYIEDPERLKSVIKGLRRALGDQSTRLENVRGVGYGWRI